MNNNVENENIGERIRRRIREIFFKRFRKWKIRIRTEGK